MICDYVDVSDEDDVNFDELSKRFWQLDVLLDDQDKEARKEQQLDLQEWVPTFGTC